MIDGSSDSAARNVLLSQHLDVRKLSERKRWTQIEILRAKIKPADVMNFSRQLGALLPAGIPSLEALNTLVENCPNKVLRKALVQTPLGAHGRQFGAHGRTAGVPTGASPWKIPWSGRKGSQGRDPPFRILAG